MKLSILFTKVCNNNYTKHRNCAEVTYDDVDSNCVDGT